MNKENTVPVNTQWSLSVAITQMELDNALNEVSQMKKNRHPAVSLIDGSFRR